MVGNSATPSVEILQRLAATVAAGATLRFDLAAVYAGCSVSQLRKLCREGRGPRFIKPGGNGRGGLVLFIAEDIDRWLETRKVGSTAEAKRLSGGGPSWTRP